jgi:hypothetical protein
MECKVGKLSDSPQFGLAQLNVEVVKRVIARLQEEAKREIEEWRKQCSER